LHIHEARDAAASGLSDIEYPKNLLWMEKLEGPRMGAI
jgi:hypothetical protein